MSYSLCLRLEYNGSEGDTVVVELGAQQPTSITSNQDMAKANAARRGKSSQPEGKGFWKGVTAWRTPYAVDVDDAEMVFLSNPPRNKATNLQIALRPSDNTSMGPK